MPSIRKVAIVAVLVFTLGITGCALFNAQPVNKKSTDTETATKLDEAQRKNAELEKQLADAKAQTKRNSEAVEQLLILADTVNKVSASVHNLASSQGGIEAINRLDILRLDVNQAVRLGTTREGTEDLWTRYKDVKELLEATLGVKIVRAEVKDADGKVRGSVSISNYNTNINGTSQPAPAQAAQSTSTEDAAVKGLAEGVGIVLGGAAVCSWLIPGCPEWFSHLGQETPKEKEKPAEHTTPTGRTITDAGCAAGAHDGPPTVEFDIVDSGPNFVTVKPLGKDAKGPICMAQFQRTDSRITRDIKYVACNPVSNGFRCQAYDQYMELGNIVNVNGDWGDIRCSKTQYVGDYYVEQWLSGGSAIVCHWEGHNGYKGAIAFAVGVR